MDLQLTGKTALITAASRGIGKAIAQSLAQEGVNLILCSRDEQDLAKTVNTIEANTSKKIEYHQVDLSNSESVQALISQLNLQARKIDILVYNMGGPMVGGFEGIRDLDWDNAHHSILQSYRSLLSVILPTMVQQKWGRVVTIASVSVRQSIDNLLLSNIFRPAVAGFNKSLSNEYAHQGITFNTICPNVIYTSRVETVLTKTAQLNQSSLEEETQKIAKTIPVGRFGKPEEVADLVAFLVSQRSGYITGSSLSIDGGTTKSIF